MAASHVLNFQQSSVRDRSSGKDVFQLDAGKAHSLRPRVPMALRIASGHAWVTLQGGSKDVCAPVAGDVFLHAGQSLWVAAGQHAVIESLGRDAVQYRFSASRAVKDDTVAHGTVSAQGAACCA
ncbi:DUF2917 domain-containing protein [Paracidovorax konjaci]|uniref:DUF2917 domain-containing protein n=1 Tax=Paracidovorax konjaci TaxID=32040 RepID=A0A1I1SC41_9BURK|nr:DUF2917 domain-containing protein [Paracidovorax konjaci]SFD44036.1 Protein of unknown function [Paracidovorax konjaci]